MRRPSLGHPRSWLGQACRFPTAPGPCRYQQVQAVGALVVDFNLLEHTDLQSFPA